MIDWDIVFIVLTFGCVLFVLQVLLDYNKRASVIRPKLNDVLRIKAHHKEELDKVLLLMEDAEKDASKHQDEINALDVKHEELENKAKELREKVEKVDERRR